MHVSLHVYIVYVNVCVHICAFSLSIYPSFLGFSILLLVPPSLPSFPFHLPSFLRSLLLSPAVPPSSSLFPSLLLPPLSPLQLKLTPQYLELMRYKAITSSTKLYFGPSIPSLFMRDEHGAGAHGAAATQLTDELPSHGKSSTED